MEAYDFGKGRFRSPDGLHALSCWRITEDTVLKRLYVNSMYEPYTMRLVSSQTSILLPRVRKTVIWKGWLYVFMEYIDGQDLTYVWSSLSLWRKLTTAWTLRGYVAQLRRIVVPHVPGPMDGSGAPRRCRGNCFGENSAGPFPAYRTLSAWYASKARITITLLRQICKNRGHKFIEPDLKFDDSLPLVMTHGDIALHNVRLGPDGSVWLLDWGASGVYPRSFEYASMMVYDTPSLAWPRSWFFLAPFIAGWYKSQNRFIRELSLAFAHFGFEDPEPDPELASIKIYG